MTAEHRQERFSALMHEHRKIVFKVAAIYARDAEDRRDLEQEILFQLWRSFARYDERRARFSTWMYRIALNVAITQVRKKAAAGVRADPLGEQHLEMPADTGEGAGDTLRIRRLYHAIDHLDPLNRALILLYLEERAYAEIAEILGISETNVATKINRIKTALRRRMGASADNGGTA